MRNINWKVAKNIAITLLIFALVNIALYYAALRFDKCWIFQTITAIDGLTVGLFLFCGLAFLSEKFAKEFFEELDMFAAIPAGLAFMCLVVGGGFLGATTGHSIFYNHNWWTEPDGIHRQIGVVIDRGPTDGRELDKVKPYLLVNLKGCGVRHYQIKEPHSYYPDPGSTVYIEDRYSCESTSLDAGEVDSNAFQITTPR